MDTNTSVQQKCDYLKRLRDLFTKTGTSRNNSVAIPRAFNNINPSDIQWATHPHKMRPLFQKMLFCIKDPLVRMSVLNNMVQLTTDTPAENMDHERERLQYQIFHAVTGRHFGEKLHPVPATRDNMKSREFFQLIYFGLRSYENMPSEQRKRFNKAVMPKDLKKQNIHVPYRLREYQK